MNYKKALKEFSKQELIELIMSARNQQLNCLIINSFSNKIDKLIDKMNPGNPEWYKLNKEVDRLQNIMEEDDFEVLPSSKNRG